MDKAIAEALWQVCHQQAGREGAKWQAARSEKAAEMHRRQCAAWATAANELYALAHPGREKENVT